MNDQSVMLRCLLPYPFSRWRGRPRYNRVAIRTRKSSATDRHTYLTLGGRAGIDLRTLQELAGHSTPTLTARYSHRRLYDLQGAVEKLPRMFPEGAAPGAERLRATGTEGPAGASPLLASCPRG
jgi:integrase